MRCDGSRTSLAQISPTDGLTGQHEATDVEMRDSLETLNACCERMPSSAGSCGRQACRRADEKSRLVEARASIQPGKSRISVVYVRETPLPLSLYGFSRTFSLYAEARALSPTVRTG